jgi:amino acid transporter
MHAFFCILSIYVSRNLMPMWDVLSFWFSRQEKYGRQPYFIAIILVGCAELVGLALLWEPGDVFVA